MKKYKKAQYGNQIGPEPYDPNQFYNYNYGNYPKPYAGNPGELPNVTVAPSRRNFGQPEVTPIRDLSYQTPSELEKESPSYQVAQNKRAPMGKQDHSFALSSVITPALGLINALLPEQDQDTRKPFEPIAYNPHAFGIPNSQAIFEDGGSLQRSKWNGTYFMKDGGKFKKVQPQPLGAQAYSPYEDSTGAPIRQLKKVESKLKIDPKPTTIKPTNVVRTNISNGLSAYSTVNPNPTTPLERLDSAYRSNMNKFDSLINSDTTAYGSNEPYINLTSGKFNTGRVPERMVDDLVKAARNNNIDPYTMLGLAGQESTFNSRELSEFSKRYPDQNLTMPSNTTMSAWNVGQEYAPYDYSRFLADKKIPGVGVEKNSRGYAYNVSPTVTNEYLQKHPDIMDQYFNKLNSTQYPEKFNYFDETAKWIKNKGIESYNPGDPNYSNMVRQSSNLLKRDPKLSKYVEGLENGGEIEYKSGGWIADAAASIKRRGTEGKCTPITKPGCTGKAKALAKTFKKIAKNRKHEDGGMIPYYQEGKEYDLDQSQIDFLLENGYELKY